MSAQGVVRGLSLLRAALTSARCGLLTLQAAMVGTLLSVSPIAVEAALLQGKTVATTNFHGTAPDTTTTIGPVNSVVGPGTELTNFADFLDIDFSDTNILITATADQPFGFLEVLRFFDVNGTIAAFTGVTVNSATNWNGFDSSKIFFTSDLIDLNLTALAGLQGQQISLLLRGASNGGNGGNGAIPEPPVYLLIGVGVLGMLGASRRRKKAA